ncbi:MAG: hypothetical protein K2W82_06785 [Candidatus Obscuribacterales bacterium]|nr:hypothetical protein [Candidatus Obscuribacterales bacterium]
MKNDPEPHKKENPFEFRYLALLNELKSNQTAEQEDLISDDVIESAINYGLSALRQGKVLIQDAD